MFYLQAWVSLFQFMCVFAFTPINAIPVIGNLDLFTVPQNLYEGGKVFLMIID